MLYLFILSCSINTSWTLFFGDDIITQVLGTDKKMLVSRNQLEIIGRKKERTF